MSASALERLSLGSLCLGRPCVGRTPRNLKVKVRTRETPERYSLHVKDEPEGESANENLLKDGSLADLFETQMDLSARGARTEGLVPILSARRTLIHEDGAGPMLSARGSLSARGGQLSARGSQPLSARRSPFSEAAPASVRLNESSESQGVGSSCSSDEESQCGLDVQEHVHMEETLEELTVTREALEEERVERLRLQEVLCAREEEIARERAERERTEAKVAELERTLSILRATGDRTTEEVPCPTSLIGRMIGRKGVHLHDIQEASGAHNIYAETRLGPPRVVVVGFPDAVAAAAELVRERIARLEGRLPMPPKEPKDPERADGDGQSSPKEGGQGGDEEGQQASLLAAPRTVASNAKRQCSRSRRRRDESRSKREAAPGASEVSVAPQQGVSVPPPTAQDLSKPVPPRIVPPRHVLASTSEVQQCTVLQLQKSEATPEVRSPRVVLPKKETSAEVSDSARGGTIRRQSAGHGGA